MSIEAYKDLSKDELVVELVKMHHELDQLKRLVFGSRQERFIPSAPPEQLGLGPCHLCYRPGCSIDTSDLLYA